MSSGGSSEATTSDGQSVEVHGSRRGVETNGTRVWPTESVTRSPSRSHSAQTSFTAEEMGEAPILVLRLKFNKARRSPTSPLQPIVGISYIVTFIPARDDFGRAPTELALDFGPLLPPRGPKCALSPKLTPHHLTTSSSKPCSKGTHCEVKRGNTTTKSGNGIDQPALPIRQARMRIIVYI